MPIEIGIWRFGEKLEQLSMAALDAESKDVAIISPQLMLATAFDTSPPEKLNQSHELIVVATELDPSTERIIAYLAENFGVPINAVYFRCFKDEGRDYLARTWLIDPDEAEAKVATSAAQRGSLLASQHTACRLCNRFTVERVTQHFGLDRESA